MREGRRHIKRSEYETAYAAVRVAGTEHAIRYRLHYGSIHQTAMSLAARSNLDKYQKFIGWLNVERMWKFRQEVTGYTEIPF